MPQSIEVTVKPARLMMAKFFLPKRAASQPERQPSVVVMFDIKLRPANSHTRRQEDERIRQRKPERRHASLRKLPGLMRLHGEIEITEEQIREKRSFREQHEDHRPPSGGAGIDRSDRQLALRRHRLGVHSLRRLAKFRLGP